MSVSRSEMSIQSPSVDTGEIANFEAMADQWWDPSGPMKPLHRLNPARLQFMRDSIATHVRRDCSSLKPLSGLTLLDVGCGGGLVSEPMARMGAQVTGIDPSEKNTGIARTHAERSGVAVTYRAATIENLAAEGALFDVVLCLEVVEHVADVQGFLDAAAAVVKPGGLMIASTLNRTFKSLAAAKIGAEYVLRWLPAGTHDWRKFMSPAELAAHLRRAGLAVTATRGLSYSPLKGQWSMTADTSINYFMIAENPAGRG